MRLGRLVLAGLVIGAVAGFVIALLRPRGTHPASLTSPVLTADDDCVPLTEPSRTAEPVPPGSGTSDPRSAPDITDDTTTDDTTDTAATTDTVDEAGAGAGAHG